MTDRKRVELNLDQKDSKKLESAIYGLSKSLISSVIKRKTEYMGSFGYNAAFEKKRQESCAHVDTTGFSGSSKKKN